MTNSKRKGSKNERKVANKFQEWTGYEFTRVPQSGGLRWQRKNDTVGDIICSDEKHSRFFQFSIECKAHNEINFSHLLLPVTGIKILEFWQQCQEDAERSNKVPLLFMRYNGMPSDYWFVTVSYLYYAQVLFELIKIDELKSVHYTNTVNYDSLIIIPSTLLFKVDYQKLHKNTKRFVKDVIKGK